MTGIPTAQSLSEWPAMIAHRVLVTPEMAREWLEATNIDNRIIRKKVVARYATMMRNGDWKPTHQGVAFSARRLIDGQHRLSAIVASGKPQWVIVFTEQSDETFAVLDHGKNRTLRDEVAVHPPVLDTASWMASTIGNMPQGSPVRAQYAAEIVERLGDIIALTTTGYSRALRGRIVGSVRAAVTLRIYESNAADREYILDQWQAWTHLDYSAMSKSLHAGAKRMESVMTGAGRDVTNERACIAWNTFDPHSRHLSKIVLRDVQTILNEMREVFNAAMAG